MRIDQFTTQAQSAVLEAQTLATTEKHAEVQPIHLLTVMLASKQGTTSSVLGRAGTDGLSDRRFDGQSVPALR